MVLQDTQIFVTVMTLNPLDLEPKDVDWCGYRGFFDESTLIARRRGLEDGYYRWTGTPVDVDDDMDSYAEEDDLWNALQREKSREPTVNDGDEDVLDLTRITFVS